MVGSMPSKTESIIISHEGKYRQPVCLRLCGFFYFMGDKCMEEVETIKFGIKQYWDWRSRSYGLDRDRSIQVADRWGAVMEELADKGHGKRALDIGTGTGQFAFYLARQGYEVTGIDLSEKMIEWAKKGADESDLNIHFRTGDAEHLDFENDRFDIVVSRNLLWTLPNPEQAIHEWHRVLKPEGRIILSDGFWRNDTWKRFSLLMMKVAKGLFSRTGTLPLRFFAHYRPFQKALPYYEGVHLNDADRLMRMADFQDIRFYDTTRFGFNPYGDDKRFFIAYADK